MIVWDLVILAATICVSVWCYFKGYRDGRMAAEDDED
jgi:hypothetical protein